VNLDPAGTRLGTHGSARKEQRGSGSGSHAVIHFLSLVIVVMLLLVRSSTQPWPMWLYGRALD
jgi:hypothetical protein